MAEWRADIFTLFPAMFPGPLGLSLAGEGLAREIWSLAAHDIRDQLGAQANAQYRLSLANDFGDERLLSDKPWVKIMLMDIHPAAHDDQEVDHRRIRRGITTVPVRTGHVVPIGSRPDRDLARPLAGGVLQIVEVHDQ